MDLRSWCSSCSEVVGGDSAVSAFQGEHRGHSLVPIGVKTDIEVVVVDRRLDFDVGRFGYQNNVGHARGRTPVQQERFTRDQITKMKQRAIEARRNRKIGVQSSQHTEVVGAIPSARLFGMKKQYGMDYLERPKEACERDGLWWGD